MGRRLRRDLGKRWQCTQHPACSVTTLRGAGPRRLARRHFCAGLRIFKAPANLPNSASDALRDNIYHLASAAGGFPIHPASARAEEHWAEAAPLPEEGPQRGGEFRARSRSKWPNTGAAGDQRLCPPAHATKQFALCEAARVHLLGQGFPFIPIGYISAHFLLISHFRAFPIAPRRSYWEHPMYSVSGGAQRRNQGKPATAVQLADWHGGPHICACTGISFACCVGLESALSSR